MRFLPVLVLVGACTDPGPVEPPPPPDVKPRSIAVAYGGDRFAMLRHYPADGDAFGQLAIATSTDGETWQDVTRIVEHGAAVGGIAYEGGRFVAVGSQLVLASGRRASTLTSTDGTTWTRAAAPFDDVEDIASLAGVFVAAGDDGLSTTLDGAVWTPVPGTSNRWWSPRVVRAGTKLYAFGAGPAVFETADARTWFAANTGLTSVHAIGTVGPRTIGFGVYDCCYGEEPDGIMHIQLRRETDVWTFGDTLLAYPEGMFDAGPHTIVAGSGGLATTVDGETLENRAAGQITRASFATDGAGTIVMAGNDALVSHDNGLTWRRLP